MPQPVTFDINVLVEAVVEDNRILELALASGSVLIVSSDVPLLDISPWRGIPIIRPTEFVGRVDAVRRAARRRS